MTSLRIKFGQRLRYLRRQRDLTQEQLAELVGISVEFLSNMERGINAPSFETLEQLAMSLNVSVKDLFDSEVMDAIRTTIKPKAKNKHNKRHKRNKWSY